MDHFLKPAVVLLALGGISFFVIQNPLRAPEETVSRGEVVEKTPRQPREGQKEILPHIAGIVVPHHDIVRDRREALFAEISKRTPVSQRPKTVILVSPNHFEAGRALVQTSAQTWRTSLGEITPDTEVIDALVSRRAAAIEPESFANEHGVKLILADIKRTFPDAEIVPILLSAAAQEKEVEKTYAALNAACADCLLIASVDFSHYQPALLAHLHDELSLRALIRRDADTLLAKAEADSPATLSLLARWATRRNADNFHLFAHTNSGALARNPDMETTTHIFGWYQEGGGAVAERGVTFAIAGDVMLGRLVGHRYGSAPTEIFSRWGDRVFWGVDAAIANLEGTISRTPVPSDIRPTNLRFRFSPNSIEALKFLRLDAVSLANNHARDFGVEGLETTRTILREANLSTFGDPLTATEQHVLRIEGEGLTLHLIGMHALVPQVPDITPMISAMKKDPNARVLIMPHWGVEYAARHSEQQERLARAWIDAGADAVIGAHPHVIQDMEVYRGRPIIYSLGNFVFDQLFSPRTQEGLLVAGRFTDEGLELFALPHRSRDMKPELLRGAEKQRILEDLYSGARQYVRATEYGATLFFPIR